MKNDLLITASYVCHSINTTPIIRRGPVPDKVSGHESDQGLGQSLSQNCGQACALGTPMDHVYGRLSVVLGPIYVLYLHVLKWFGLEDSALIDNDEFNALSAEIIEMSDNAVYWQGAIDRLLRRAAKRRAKHKAFTTPDWFIWLSRFHVGIAPARLKAIMAAQSVKGRVFVMGLATRVKACVTCADASGMSMADGLFGPSKLDSAGVWTAHIIPD